MIERVRGYCALCRSRCGRVSVVEDGRLVAVEPDPSHPTGQALGAKGRAAPELVHHPERLLPPLRRTRPKGDPDPGWERIGWDEALAHVAASLRRIADAHRPEAVAFAVTSPSGTAISDAAPWIDGFMNPSPLVQWTGALAPWGRSSDEEEKMATTILRRALTAAACVLSGRTVESGDRGVGVSRHRKELYQEESWEVGVRLARTAKADEDGHPEIASLMEEIAHASRVLRARAATRAT